VNVHKTRLLLEIIVKILSRYLKRLISGDDVMGSNAASLRNIIVWVFIALVAAFLTHPNGDPRSDTPVPWPAELGWIIRGFERRHSREGGNPY
jgi:hypothetical protein